MPEKQILIWFYGEGGRKSGLLLGVRRVGADGVNCARDSRGRARTGGCVLDTGRMTGWLRNVQVETSRQVGSWKYLSKALVKGWCQRHKFGRLCGNQSFSVNRIAQSAMREDQCWATLTRRGEHWKRNQEGVGRGPETKRSEVLRGERRSFKVKVGDCQMLQWWHIGQILRSVLGDKWSPETQLKGHAWGPTAGSGRARTCHVFQL